MREGLMQGAGKTLSPLLRSHHIQPDPFSMTATSFGRLDCGINPTGWRIKKSFDSPDEKSAFPPRTSRVRVLAPVPHQITLR
jgi:hypothetical protein